MTAAVLAGAGATAVGAPAGGTADVTAPPGAGVTRPDTSAGFVPPPAGRPAYGYTVGWRRDLATPGDGTPWELVMIDPGGRTRTILGEQAITPIWDVSLDGRSVVTTTSARNGTATLVRVIDPVTSAERSRFVVDRPSVGVAFGPSGLLATFSVAYGDPDQRITLRTPAGSEARILAPIPGTGRGRPWFSPDGSTLVQPGPDPATVLIRDGLTGRLRGRATMPLSPQEKTEYSCWTAGAWDGGSISVVCAGQGGSQGAAFRVRHDGNRTTRLADVPWVLNTVPRTGSSVGLGRDTFGFITPDGGLEPWSVEGTHAYSAAVPAGGRGRNAWLQLIPDEVDPCCSEVAALDVRSRTVLWVREAVGAHTVDGLH